MQLNGHEIVTLLETITGSGVAVFIAAKLLKKLAKGHLDEDIHKVVVALTALLAYLQYADQLHAVLPPTILGISATSIYGVSQAVYKAANTLLGFLNRTQKAADSNAPIVTSETPAAEAPPAAATF